VDFAFGACITV